MPLQRIGTPVNSQLPLQALGMLGQTQMGISDRRRQFWDTWLQAIQKRNDQALQDKALNQQKEMGYLGAGTQLAGSAATLGAASMLAPLSLAPAGTGVAQMGGQQLMSNIGQSPFNMMGWFK